jgi:hypothetical protein
MNCQEFFSNLLFVKTVDTPGTVSRLALVSTKIVSLKFSFADFPIPIGISWETNWYTL